MLLAHTARTESRTWRSSGVSTEVMSTRSRGLAQDVLVSMDRAYSSWATPRGAYLVIDAERTLLAVSRAYPAFATSVTVRV
jgi:hypothetical protein